MTAKKQQKDEVTTYFLSMRDGTKQKITCPTKWKITFGPLVPGSKDGNLNGSGATSLRFYDGTHQKAVFTGVESFRDMSIGIEVEVEKVQQETFYKDAEDGEKKQVIVEGRTREWINPDAPSTRTRTESKSKMQQYLSVDKD